MTIRFEFRFGQVVFLRCRPERKAGMITAVHGRPEASLSYGVTWGDGNETCHFAFELATEFLPDYSNN